MPKLKKGDTVTIEATVTRVSEDGAEVSVRISHYGYPVTLPVNSVTKAEPKPGGWSPDEPKDIVRSKPRRGRSKLSKILGDD